MKNIKIFIASLVGKITIISIIGIILISLIIIVSVGGVKKNKKNDSVIKISSTLLVPSIKPIKKAKYTGTFVAYPKFASINLGIFKIPNTQKNLEGNVLKVNTGTISYGNITSNPFSGNLLTGVKFTVQILFRFELKENNDKTKLILTLNNDLPPQNNIHYDLLLSW